MGHKFAEIAFTPVVRSLQVADGSRAGYARMAEGEDYNHRLTAREGTFIHGQCQRDGLALCAAPWRPGRFYEGCEPAHHWICRLFR